MKAKKYIKVARTLVMKDDKILLGQRSDTKEWELPGGKVEKNELECPGFASARELEEETGLRADGMGLLLWSMVHRYKKRDYITYFYRWSTIKGEPKCMEKDHLAWNYFSLSDLKTLKLTKSSQLFIKMGLPVYLDSQVY